MKTTKPAPTSQQERVTTVWKALEAQGWTPDQIVEVITDMLEHEAGAISRFTRETIEAQR